MRIACLHTAHSNIAVFYSALLDLNAVGVELNHTVRAELLSTAEAAGCLTPEIVTQTQEALLALCKDSDVVLLTCSTLGPSVNSLQSRTRTPVIRVDEALAKTAVSQGGRIVVLCAVETTVQPTSQLFLTAAQGSDSEVEILLVSHAWDLFKAGDIDAYLCSIAEAADKAYRDGANIVALAQASMAKAASLIKHTEATLTSPRCGLQAAILALT